MITPNGDISFGETAPNPKTVKPTAIYSIPDTELKRANLQEGIVARLIESPETKRLFLDIRKFFRGNPTRKGVKLTKEQFDIIKDIFN